MQLPRQIHALVMIILDQVIFFIRTKIPTFLAVIHVAYINLLGILVKKPIREVKASCHIDLSNWFVSTLRGSSLCKVYTSDEARTRVKLIALNFTAFNPEGLLQIRPTA